MKQNSAEKLCEKVLRRYATRLNAIQLRAPWTYIGTHNGEISGVIVPADGEHPSYRVMLVDLELPEFET